MTNKLTVLVFGATGNQGGSVVKSLLPKGHSIRTMTRNPDSDKAKKLKEQGVEVMKGDFTGVCLLSMNCNTFLISDTIFFDLSLNSF